MSLKLAEDVLRDRAKHQPLVVALAEAYVELTKRHNEQVLAADDKRRAEWPVSVATDRERNYDRILRALDAAVCVAAVGRGIPSCDCVGTGDGASDVTPGTCDLGGMHTKAALLASGIANAIDEPNEASITTCIELVSSFVTGLAVTFADHDKIRRS